MMDDFNLFEKAASKSQQRLMGAVHAYQKTGKLPSNADFAAKIKSIADGGQKKKRGKGKTKGMSNKDTKKFAQTKHKDLPETVSEGFASFVEHAEGDGWVHRSFAERTGQAQKPGRQKLLKKIKNLGSTSRREPSSWSQDVKRRAFDTVRNAVKSRFSEAATTDPFPMGGGRESGYRELGTIAKEVWAANDIEEKRTLVHELIDSFKFTKKQARHHMAADKATTPGKLDFLASSLALADEKVIK